MLLTVRVPLPLPSRRSGLPGDRFVLMSTGPGMPDPPVWMCARLMGVPPGKLETCAEKFTVPPPLTPPVAGSRDTLNVIVAVPRAFASAFVIGGVSFWALSCAVNTMGPVLLVGVVGLSLPQAAASISAVPIAASRFIGPPPRVIVVANAVGIRDPGLGVRKTLMLRIDGLRSLVVKSPPLHSSRFAASCVPMPESRAASLESRVDSGLEPPHQIEPEIDIVRAAAARDLAERRPERVGEVQLHRVARRLFFDGESPRAAPGIVALHAR